MPIKCLGKNWSPQESQSEGCFRESDCRVYLHPFLPFEIPESEHARGESRLLNIIAQQQQVIEQQQRR